MSALSSTTREPLLRVNDVAVLLSIGRRTVYTLVGSGELPAVRVGARMRFRQEDVDRYLEARKVVAG
jgi:excisionase family DNA binding protein